MTRVSIITPTRNSAGTLKMALDSVRLQHHPEIEHIVIDGNSSDRTLELLDASPDVHWISEPDSGIYDAINKGLSMATGDVVGVLNADDFLATPAVIQEIVEGITSHDAVYRDVSFVHPSDLRRVVRDYRSANFRPGMFLAGFMPAHPSFYARRSLFTYFGDYRRDYRICADYELLLRFILIHGIRTRYIPGTHAIMRTGGVSNATPISRWRLNREMVRACRENGISVGMQDLIWKYPSKFKEYLGPGLSHGVRLDLNWLITPAGL